MRKIYLLFTVVALLTACEKTDDLLLENPPQGSEKQTTKISSNIKSIKAREIPEVLNVVEGLMESSNKSSKKNSLGKSHLEKDKILEVRNKDDKINYTFPLFIEGQPENEFYNVIVHKTASGKIKKPYVKRYRVDPDALENYKAHNRDFRYFKGTYSNYWFDDFFNSFDNEGGKVKFKAISTCDDGGTIGGGGTYNPDLIDVDNDVTWNGLAQTGYGRALGTWNHYGGTGGYDLDVRVSNNSTGNAEVATVNSITSGSVVVSTGYSSITVNINGSTTWMDISTETSGSSGGSTGGECSGITITRGTDGGYTVDVGDCLPVQKSSQPNTKAASGCPEDDGEVGVIDDSTKLLISKRIGLAADSPEHAWLWGELTNAEQQQVYDLNLYFIKNTTVEAKYFGLEALRIFMASGEVDFEEQILNELDGKALCVYNKLNQNSTSFADAIKKFDGEFPVSHLRIKADPTMTSNTLKAIVTPPSNYIVNITLNGNSTKDASYQKRPNLMVAKTLFHEVIHAEMWRKILSILDNGGDVAGLTKQEWTNKLSNGDYPGIFDYYTRYGVNGFQHPQMAAHYRQTIADALQKFDNNNNTPQFYKDLAWEGLIYRNDPTWNALSPSEQTRIKNVINNYANQNQNESCVNP